MSEEWILKKQRQINAGASQVWSVLTSPGNIEKWLGVKTKSDWTQGSEVLFSFSWDGKEHTDKGHILEFERDSLFTYSYWSVFSGLPDKVENYSKIEFRLSADGQNTILELTHSDFSSETMFKHSDENWEESLDTIKALAEE